MVARIAYPPILMDLPQAGAYLCMCEDAAKTFLALHGVGPVDVGQRRRLYRRADIDAAVDKLAIQGVDPVTTPQAIDPAEAALQSARRRVRA